MDQPVFHDPQVCSVSYIFQTHRVLFLHRDTPCKLILSWSDVMAAQKPKQYATYITRILGADVRRERVAYKQF